MLAVVYVPKINVSLMIDSLPYILQGLPYTKGISVVKFIL